MKLVLFSTFFLHVYSQKFAIPNEAAEKGQQYWMQAMKTDLQNALKRTENNKVAKNVIMFIGDGMGVTVKTAGRIYKGQKEKASGEETILSWEEFPNAALLKTYNLDYQVPDSAATATAYFGGVKANFYTLGTNGAVQMDDCQAELVPENRVSSILKWAQDAGKDTGIVTNTRITHATPAALYAHSSQRNWECDSEQEQSVIDAGCKDIAVQMVENSAGLNANVIFGGGRQQLGANLTTDNDSSCNRSDGRNIVDEWLADKEKRGFEATYVTNTKDFNNVDMESVDHIIGLFAGGHQPYEIDRDQSPEGTPSIGQLTEAAIKRLKRSSTGYFLMVEGGRIDHALHDTKPKYTLEEFIAFDDAIEGALKLIGDDDETLIIVTADHSHVMTINGYPNRGNDILGIITENKALDKMPYATLMFTNGPGGNFTVEEGKSKRQNLTDVDTTDKNFVSPALVHVESGSETHGGEDVALHAKGPMSHLFHKVHEQSYVAHVAAFAACIGPYKDDCDRSRREKSLAAPAL